MYLYSRNMAEGEKSMPSELNPTKPERDFVELRGARAGEEVGGVCVAPPRGIGRRTSSSPRQRWTGSGDDVANGVWGCRCRRRRRRRFGSVVLSAESACGKADAAL